MMRLRVALAAAGIGFGLWGLWLVRDFSTEQLTSTGTWLIGGIVVHDLVLAPLTVAVGVAVSRALRGRVRAAVATAVILWATLTVVAVPVLSGQGGKPDNDTILNRPYLASWLVISGVLLGTALVLALRGRRPTRPAEPAED